MNIINRRDFLKFVGAAGAASSLGLLGTPVAACAKSGGRVLVIGGGFGGATCAKYLRTFDPGLDVTLLERDPHFVTCLFSNLVLGGLRDMASITHSFDTLKKKHGIKVIQDEVVAIDAGARKVTLKSGNNLPYDKLVISPGIDFRFDTLDGYDEAVSQKIPHAWKGGPQTVILRNQLQAMRDGGLVIMAPPDNPFRCPPGPYERASMIAHYLTKHKPKSKVLILDAKDKFSKQPLFMQGWQARYPGMIEWIAGSKGGRLERVDGKTMTLHSELGQVHKGDVLNVIPAQKAGEIAHTAGLVNADGWCPVDQRTFESKVHKDVHVIGDASIAGKLPKSGFAANSEAKVCAAAIVSALSGQKMPEPSYVNTCYSLVAPDYGISVAMIYRLTDAGISNVKGAGGVSPKDASPDFRRQEADYTRGWYASITSDTWG